MSIYLSLFVLLDCGNIQAFRVFGTRYSVSAGEKRWFLLRLFKIRTKNFTERKKYFTPYSSVSIVNFEQVIAGWV